MKTDGAVGEPRCCGGAGVFSSVFIIGADVIVTRKRLSRSGRKAASENKDIGSCIISTFRRNWTHAV